MINFLKSIEGIISYPFSILMLIATYTSVIACIMYALLLFFPINIMVGIILLTILVLFFHVWGLKQ